jgi:hypothetical protein
MANDSISDSRFPDNSNLDFDAALTDASINARIERLSLYQKLMMVRLLGDGRFDLRFGTYNALEKMGFVRDRLTPGYWGYMWDELTAEGIIATLRLLDPEHKDGSLFYHLSRQRVIWEHARNELRQHERRWDAQERARNTDARASEEGGVQS